MSRRLARALRNFVVTERDRREYGRLHPDIDLIASADRPDFVNVILDSGGQTLVLNKGPGRVALRANLPVRVLRRADNELIMDGEDDRLLENDSGSPSNPYGVPSHPLSIHSDVAWTALADGDGPIWDDASSRWINLPAVISVNGATGTVVLTTTNIAEGTNLYLTQERVEDYVAAQFTGNTGVIDATYDDGTGAITLTLDVSVADRILYSTGADAWAEATLTAYARTLLDDADAATARATLGLVIGTNVQAFDATLTSLAALGTTADRIAYTTALDTWAETPLTAFGRSLIDDAAASNARTTLGLVIGTDVQAQDAELAAIAGLTSAADRLPYFTGSGTASLATFTAYARTLLDDADAATARTTLGLGTIATEAETAYALLAGRAGGQVLYGGTAANEDITIDATSHATKTSAYILLNPTGGRVGIGTTSPLALLNVVSNSGFNAQMRVTNDAGSVGDLVIYESGDAGSVMGQSPRGNITSFANTGGKFVVGTAQAFDLILGTNSTERQRITSAGLFGFGVTAPQGKMHVHDGTGGLLFVTKTGVAGTDVTLLPNGTGDVTGYLYITGFARGSGGVLFAFADWIAISGTRTVTSGSDGFRVRVNADGSVDCARTGGTQTYTCVFHLIWY